MCWTACSRLRTADSFALISCVKSTSRVCSALLAASLTCRTASKAASNCGDKLILLMFTSFTSTWKLLNAMCKSVCRSDAQKVRQHHTTHKQATAPRSHVHSHGHSIHTHATQGTLWPPRSPSHLSRTFMLAAISPRSPARYSSPPYRDAVLRISDRAMMVRFVTTFSQGPNLRNKSRISVGMMRYLQHKPRNAKRGVRREIKRSRPHGAVVDVHASPCVSIHPHLRRTRDTHTAQFNNHGRNATHSM